jgi:hypothetical protein
LRPVFDEKGVLISESRFGVEGYRDYRGPSVIGARTWLGG